LVWSAFPPACTATTKQEQRQIQANFTHFAAESKQQGCCFQAKMLQALCSYLATSLHSNKQAGGASSQAN
jgi:hypothetical protein